MVGEGSRLGVAGDSLEKVKGQKVEGWGHGQDSMGRTCHVPLRLVGTGTSGGRREGQQDIEKLHSRAAVPSSG